MGVKKGLSTKTNARTFRPGTGTGATFNKVSEGNTRTLQTASTPRLESLGYRIFFYSNSRQSHCAPPDGCGDTGKLFKYRKLGWKYYKPVNRAEKIPATRRVCLTEQPESQLRYFIV